jgi:hypothetical protein
MIPLSTKEAGLLVRYANMQSRGTDHTSSPYVRIRRMDVRGGEESRASASSSRKYSLASLYTKGAHRLLA